MTGSAYALAAAGDHDAQVEMAHIVLADGLAGTVAMNDAILLALMWSNMAATSGNASHALTHAAVLLVQAGRAIEDGHTEAECQGVYAQALAITDRVADTGHARAELVALTLAAQLPAETIAKAQSLRANININPLSADERIEGDKGLNWIISRLNEVTKEGR